MLFAMEKVIQNGLKEKHVIVATDHGCSYRTATYVTNEPTGYGHYTCGFCGTKDLLGMYVRAVGGGVVQEAYPCTNCGAQNVQQRYGSKGSRCFLCDGAGFLPLMNCQSCTDGRTNCNTCGGDRKDEL